MWKQIISLLALLTIPLIAEGQTSETTFSAEWQQLRTDHGVLAWYMRAINHPEDLKSGDHFTTLPMLHLVEIGDETFNRKTSPVRKNIEAEILSDIEQAMVGEPEDAPVRLLSLSCTGHLEDWHIIGQLIQSGRKHIDLTIVDTEMIAECMEGLVQLSEALKEEGVSLTISFRNTLAGCTSSKFHCGYAVSCYTLLSFQKNTWGTLPAARKLLLPKGHLFVSYLQESIRVDAQGKVHVLTSSSENQLLRKTIVAAQRNNPRDKESSLRFQLASEPLFVPGPLLYALSDLFEEGYRDISVFTFSWQNDMSESDLSAFISDATGGKASIHWQKSCYIRHKQEDRRDMIIFSFPGVEIDGMIDKLSRDFMILGTLLPREGHWIIRGDQLGIWDINGMGFRKAISVPEANKKKAEKYLDALFAEKGHWY